MSAKPFEVRLPAVSGGDDLVLEAPSFHMALVVADINSDGQPAEIWQQERRVATVRRHGEGRATWWEMH